MAYRTAEELVREAERKPGAKRGAEALLPLSEVHRDPLLRSRVGPLDRDHVAGLADSISAGHPPPRATVYQIGGRGHFLVGGWHTADAYELAGKTELPAYVIRGTWAEAVVAAASQNQEYDTAGLKRSRQDMRHAVEMVLAAHPDWSDRKIAAAVGVGHEMVGARRAVLAETARAARVADSATCPTSAQPRFRLGADGKKYPLPTPDRSRPSGRAEHQGQHLQPSWEAFGGAVLPLLKNDIPLPSVLAANQLNLKQLSCVIGRWLDLFDGPVYCPVARRLLAPAEKAAWLEWLVTNTFPELYDEASVFGESLDVLRDPRFPAGALP